MVRRQAEPQARRGRTSTVARRNLLAGLGAAGIAATVLLLGGILSGSHAVDPIRAAIAAAGPTPAQQNAPPRPPAGLSTGGTPGYARKPRRAGPGPPPGPPPPP